MWLHLNTVGPLIVLIALVQPNLDLPKARAMLENRYAALSKAFQKVSYPAFHQWMADNAGPNFFFRTGTGQIYATSETLTSMKTEFLVLKSVQASTYKLGNFSIHPDHISCSVKNHLEAMTKDKRRLVSDSLAVDIWKRVNGKWKLESLVITKERNTVNGKALPSGT